MANSITFMLVPSGSVTISKDEADTQHEFTPATVQMITVMGDPWVVFNTPNYGGKFTIFKKGKYAFPSDVVGAVIKSLRVIKQGIESSQVIFYPLSFYEGAGVKFESDQTELPENFFSLKVAKGAVIFYDETCYGGEKRILLNGDHVENFTAVKLPCIGKSMKTAYVTK